MPTSRADHGTSRQPPDSPDRDITSQSRKTAKRTHKRLWGYIASPPPEQRVFAVMSKSHAKCSLRPIATLSCSGVAKSCLATGTHLLARQIADPSTKDALVPPNALASSPPQGMPSAHNPLMPGALIMGLGIGLTLASNTLFALDTRKACRNRALTSFLLGTGGLACTGVGAGLNEFYKTMDRGPTSWSMIAPIYVGMAMMLIRLPYSFSCSEFVHGDTPLPHRREVSIALFALSMATMTVYERLYPFTETQPWALNIVSTLLETGLILAFSLRLTDAGRKSWEHYQDKDSQPTTPVFLETQVNLHLP